MKVIESMKELSINETWIILYCFLGMRQQMHNIENLYKRNCYLGHRLLFRKRLRSWLNSY